MDADVVVTQTKLIEFRRLQKTHHRHFKFYEEVWSSTKAAMPKNFKGCCGQVMC